MQNETEKIIQNVASQSSDSDKNAEIKDQKIQLVVFELDKEEYAVEITDLQEIKEVPEVTPIPNAPNFISGIFNLRGKIIIVVNLEKRFNLVRDHEHTGSENIIITEVSQNSFGILVDRVKEIINIPKSTIQSTPSLVSTKIHASYLKGVVVMANEKNQTTNAENKTNNEENMDSRLIILLDLPKMLQEKELLSFSSSVKDVAQNTENDN
ncbi:hypothetical protein C0583_04880 [Candidatus Parcubacteria bacterium]|nr:MAG: hypothetical protein C0583_04880 [Candidatus Parcubacteria bacterium]